MAPMQPPSHEIRIEPTGDTFRCAEDETVLTAAARAGVPMPSSCRTGTCRTCMRKLLAGQVAWTVEWPGLSPDEKEEGWILPCVALPRSALALGELAQRPWWEQGR